MSDKGMVLLIEDKPQMRRFLRVAGTRGYKVEEAKTGGDGITQAAGPLEEI